MASRSTKFACCRNELARSATTVRYIAALALLITSAMAGCGQTGLPGMVPIRGRVLFDGVPLANAEIRYVPMNEMEGRVARGALNDQGEFELTTLHTGDGALPGEYRVLVLAYDTVTVEGRNAAGKKPDVQLRSRIPEVYTEPRASPLSDTVDAAHSGYKEFVLQTGEPTRTVGASGA